MGVMGRGDFLRERSRSDDRALRRMGGGSSRTALEQGLALLAGGLSDEPELHGIGKKAAEKKTFREFVSDIRPTYQWHTYAERLAELLQQVADGELTRLMVFMPPRIGKTEAVSRLFPAYYLSRYPERHVGLASYAAALAHRLSRAAMANYMMANGPLPMGAAASTAFWETGAGGSLWATGAGGPATGQGFHLGIVDDPIKNAQEAASQVRRDSLKDWWELVWHTRQEAGFASALVLCMTRWHLDDLAGWLLSLEEAAEVGSVLDSGVGGLVKAEGWTILSMPMIATGRAFDAPVSCTVVPDWRSPGEVLCPERFSVAAVAARRSKMTAHGWSALYQQEPVPEGGSLCKWEDFSIVDAEPGEPEVRVRYWDLAGTEGGGDETCGALVALDKELRPWVVDLDAGRWGLAQRDAEMVRCATEDRERYGTAIEWVIEQDTGMGGNVRTASIMAKIGPFVKATVYKPSGDKVQRAEPFYAQVQARNCRLVSASWNDATRRQLCDFPYSEHDDRVDSIAGAYNRAAEIIRERSKYRPRAGSWGRSRRTA